ncbi:hypothetical protein HK101_002759 [Irineochytrium annulatum]|nr:hypothetical protein HK101_002759 [Irineochytrium annulatum]
MRMPSLLALVASGLALVASVAADVNQYHWTSDGINSIQPGYALLSAYDSTVKFVFYTNGDIGIQINGESVLGRLPLTGGKVDPTQPAPQLQITADGHLLLEDGNGNTLSEITNATADASFFGTANAPFSVSVDYDRRARLRSSDNAHDILWTYPPPRTHVDPLDTEGIAFLSAREQLASPSGKWWIMIRDDGVITTNSGYNFNIATQIKVVPPRVLILHADGSLVFYDCKGVVHPISVFPGPQAGDAASYVLQITDDGLIQIINTVTGVQTWSFQIPPISIADDTETKCLTNGKPILQPCLSNGDKKQEWEIINGALTSASNSDLCLDATSVTIMPCSDAFNGWTYNAQTYALQANGNCLTMGSAGITLATCAPGFNQVWTTNGKPVAVPGTYAPIYHVFGGRCLAAASASVSALVTINTCTGSDLQSWSPNADGTIRLKANNLLCVDVQNNLGKGNALMVAFCNPSSASQKWAYNANTAAFTASNGVYAIDVDNNLNTEGQKVQAWPTNKGTAQSWQIGGTYQTMNLNGGAFYIFDSRKNNLAIRHDDASTKLDTWSDGDNSFKYFNDNGLLRTGSNQALCLTYDTNQGQGTKVTVRPCFTTTNGQTTRSAIQWDIGSDGAIRNHASSGMCLNDSGGNHNAGDAITIWPFSTGDSASKWTWSNTQPQYLAIGLRSDGSGVATLYEGQSVYSPSQSHSWQLTSNGWLVHANTGLGLGPMSNGYLTPSTSPNHPYRITMQTDGNLVIYSSTNEVIYASGTYGHPGARIDISDSDGAIVFTNPDGVHFFYIGG